MSMRLGNARYSACAGVGRTAGLRVGEHPVHDSVPVKRIKRWRGRCGRTGPASPTFVCCEAGGRSRHDRQPRLVTLRSPFMTGGKSQVCGPAGVLMAAAGAAIAALLAVAGRSSTPHVASVAATASPTASLTPTPTASPPPAPLTAKASVTRRHPKTGAKAGVLVSTAPGARITVVAHYRAGDRTKTARADSAGLHASSPANSPRVAIASSWSDRPRSQPIGCIAGKARWPWIRDPLAAPVAWDVR
jgi:hypothetical protein